MCGSVSHSIVSDFWRPCSSPGSSVYGMSQANILEWVAISFSRASFRSRDQTWISHIAGRFYTREAQWVARLFQLFGGKGQGFPGIGPLPPFYLLWLPSVLSWCWWVCHLGANVSQWAYNKAQDLLEFNSSTILDLVGLTSFYLVSGLVILLKIVSHPLSSF